MEKNLATLVRDYEKSQSNVDEYFIKTAGKIINENFGTDVEVNLVNNKNVFNGATAKYIIDDNVINVYKNNILNEISEEVLANFPQTYSKHYEYLYYLEQLLHEFECAREYKILRHKSDLEGTILNEEITLVNEKLYPKKLRDIRKAYEYQKLYRNFADCSVVERLASTNTFDHCYKISTTIGDNLSSYYSLCNYYDSLLRGYELNLNSDNYITPTEEFFNAFEVEVDWNNIYRLLNNEEDALKVTKLGLQYNQDYLRSLEELSNKNGFKLKRIKK